MPNVAKAMLGKHKAVLLKESIDALDLKPGETFLDGTFGAGGHSREVRRRFGESVEIIALDQDPDVSLDARKLESLKVEFHTENFRNLDRVLEARRVNAILLDIGLSSDQLETSGRGFTFQKDEPLDMRMGGRGPTAADILNSWDESAIELILRGFGEERLSRQIAHAIVERREEKPFQTTFDLVRAVESVRKRTAYDKIHPATRTFQALRIATNEELPALEEALEKGFDALAPGGRFAVISFHSLEDRIVKNFFREKVDKEQATTISKKPITPSEEEIETNPRSRSAKLRIIRKNE